MTYGELKDHVMHQTNNDSEDLGDFLPYLDRYLFEGYDRLLFAWANIHVGDDVMYPAMKNDADVPLLPEWTHNAIADWATWLVYRNGNPQKQSRGMQYRYAFEEVLARVRASGGAYAAEFGGANGENSIQNFKNHLLP